MDKDYLTAKQVEGILQTVREKQDYIGKIEREVTRAMVATGKRNSTIPGKGVGMWSHHTRSIFQHGREA